MGNAWREFYWFASSDIWEPTKSIVAPSIFSCDERRRSPMLPGGPPQTINEYCRDGFHWSSSDTIAGDLG